jgi:hypothetical protein
MVLAIDRANRAGLFPKRPAQLEDEEAEESAALLVFDRDLRAESAG